MNIDEEFDAFFEFPTESKAFVTSISAKLFAEHCVKKYRDALEKISNWPDGGNRYGQEKIKRYARDVLMFTAPRNRQCDT